MTLCLAWLRSVADVTELVVATDSRLRSPFTWDCCPKILPLQRGDSAICFAGESYLAYPIMVQLQNALRLHPKTLSRATDLRDLKGYFLEVLNSMREDMREFPSDPTVIGEAETAFLLAGYSWRASAFMIWTLHYASDIRRFTFRRERPWTGANEEKQIAMVGDVREDAKERLVSVLRGAGRLTKGGLDMEPLAVLRDMIRSGSYHSLGGPPQVVKIYRHMNVTPLGVYWPTRASGKVSLLGRPLLHYETTQVGAIDPDTFEIF